MAAWANRHLMSQCNMLPLGLLCPQVQPLVDALVEKTRQRMAKLLAAAYSQVWRLGHTAGWVQGDSLTAPRTGRHVPATVCVLLWQWSMRWHYSWWVAGMWLASMVRFDPQVPSSIQ